MGADPDALLALALGASARTQELAAAAGRLAHAATAAGAIELIGTAHDLARLAERWGDLDRQAASTARALLDSQSVLLADPGAAGAGGGRQLGPDALLLGDLATADRVVVLVPGMGNDQGRITDRQRAKAEALYESARALGADAAVIVWLGYDPPDGLDVLRTEPGANGAAALAAFVRELALRPGARLTVIGHSYGSLVVGGALARHELARFRPLTAVVVTGSPGMGVRDARELRLGTVPLYALRAPFDGVALSEAFGRDPTDPRFGAIRLDTGDPGTDALGHGDYLVAGTGSLANVAAVVTGRTERLIVEEPSTMERRLDAIDERLEPFTAGPIERAGEAVHGLDALADALDDRLPSGGAIGAAAEAGSDLRDGAVLTVDALTHAARRATSVDFWGDLAGDVADLID